MEIERKFLVAQLPSDLSDYPSYPIEQAYLSKEPVLRVRKGGTRCTLTYKGSGLMSREEYNLPLTEEAYLHLKEKADGRIITKTRYKIPYEHLTIELDIFSGVMEGLVMAEVEFFSEEEALSFTAPGWFGEEVTYDPAYHNVNMAYGL